MGNNEFTLIIDRLHNDESCEFRLSESEICRQKMSSREPSQKSPEKKQQTNTAHINKISTAIHDI